MENQRPVTPHKTIIRLAELLRRKGFSRLTLYLLIAKGEFPHRYPCSRSVSWIEEEVDAWIAHRANLRPASESQNWIQNAPSAPTLSDSSTIVQPQNKSSRNSHREKSPRIDGGLTVPDFAQVNIPQQSWGLYGVSRSKRLERGR